LKRTVITAVLLLAATAGAQAVSLDTYRDLIRPHGHPRSDVVFQAALDACYGATGASRFRPDTPAFRQCMLGRGYRWRSMRDLPEPRTRVSKPDTSYEPEPPPPVESPPVVIPRIDPITGEVFLSQ
jgi:hypothetical protein